MKKRRKVSYDFMISILKVREDHDKKVGEIKDKSSLWEMIVNLILDIQRFYHVAKGKERQEKEKVPDRILEGIRSVIDRNEVDARGGVR